MPDESYRGKRLHLIRLAAAGMASPAPADQRALDEAEQLVDRVVAMAPGRAPEVRPAWVAAFVVFATLFVCLLVSAGVAVAMGR